MNSETTGTPSPRGLGEVLEELAVTIASRRGADHSESYTARLLEGDEDQLLKKIGEEATEVVMAAKDGDADHLRWEVSDLLYHVLVVCERWGVELTDIANHLAQRRR